MQFMDYVKANATLSTDYRFRLARKDEADTVLSLYQAVIGTPFCVWNDEYPGRLEIDNDMKNDSLFVLEYDGRIVGAISIVPKNELDALEFWSTNRKVGEFARVVIHPEYQGRRLARLLVSNVLAVMKKRGYENVHISVACGNIPAQKTYRSIGFQTVGKAEMWGHRYDLCELRLN